MTGHVRRRGVKAWELKFDLGTDPLTGKRRIRYHRFKGTKREAELERARLFAAASTGDYVDASRNILAKFLDRWDALWAAANVGPRTLERYRELARVHIRPHLGGDPLQKLKTVHFAELYAMLLREGKAGRGEGAERTGLSARTVGHVHRPLHRALGHGSPMITLGVCGHPFANTDDRAAQFIEAAFSKALSTE